MKDLDIEKDYGHRIRKLFELNQHQDVPFIERGFAYTQKVEQQGVLFVGLNPSFRQGHKHESFYYDTRKSCNDQYLKKYWELAEYCGLPCAHIDLLALRETAQANIWKLKDTHLDFLVASLDLTKEILEATRPKAIIVTDTKAKTFLGKDKDDNKNIWMGYDFGEMSCDGTFRIQNVNSNLKEIPVFFSGMFSGVRALDLGSYERLKWHVKQVVDGNTKFQ